MTNYTILDIETIPNEHLSDDEKPQFDRESVSLGNLKDEVKIEIKRDDAEKKFNAGITKTMSLSSNYGRILSLGAIIIDESGNEQERFVYYGENEDISILRSFKQKILSYSSNLVFVGWNSKGFDLPMIWKRSILNEEKIWAFNYYDKLIAKYNSSQSIDLMNVWNGHGGFGKLIDCCKSLKIPAKTGLDGSMIFDAWKAGEKEKIIEYNMQDCEATKEIFLKVFL